MASKPVRISTLLNLRDLGFTPSCFKFGITTLEGDRYLCIKEVETATPSVAIIDLYNGNSVSKRPMKAEAAIMNPDEPIIALRAPTDGGHFIQLFHLETKEKLATHQFDGKIALWRWISKTELAIVTDHVVYHWRVGEAEPRHVFERSGKLAEAATKLVGYEADADKKWCILYGIYSVDQGVTIEGALQLYSTERSQQQLLEGYAATFANLRLSSDVTTKTGLLVFCEHKRSFTGSKLHVMDIYTQKTDSGKPPFKVSKDITWGSVGAGDFPIATYVLDSCGLVAIVTKSGHVHFHDAATATLLFSEQLSTSPLFITCPKRQNGKFVGVLAVNRDGQVLEVIVDEHNLLHYIPPDLAVGIATRFGLPGAEDLLLRSFDELFLRQEYKKAALVVVTLKSQHLRTRETIEKFKNAPAVPGQPSPASHYFSVLLEHGKLNPLESVELVKPVVAQGKAELIKKWLEQDKLTESEELGDLVRKVDSASAFKIFTRLNSHLKAILCLLDANQIPRVVPFIKKLSQNLPKTHVTNSLGDVVVVVEQLPPISTILDNIVELRPEAIVPLVNDLLAGYGPKQPMCDILQVTETLSRYNRIEDLTSILLDYLKPNLPQHASLQTRLLEINLKHAPKAAEMIFQFNILSHFDKAYIAQLCEEANLHTMALGLYTSVSDLRRVIKNSNGQINPNALEKVLAAASKEDALELLHAMFDAKTIPTSTIVSCALSLKHVDPATVAQVVESRGGEEVLYNYLKALPIVMSKAPAENPSQVKLLSKYVQCCIHQEQYDSLEYLVKESNILDLNATKDLLKTVSLPTPKALMITCHRLGTLQELTEHLYHNNQEKYIEQYINSMNPLGVAEVVSTLYDLGAPESIVLGILEGLRDPGGIRAMIKVVEEHHQLFILRNWLEKRISDGYKDPEIHTAYIKLLVSSQDPKARDLLTNNKFYNRAELGKFCEERDPQLAFIIYSQGNCDADVVGLCKANGLYSQLARLALERQSPKFWQLAFSSTPDATSDDKENIKKLCEELRGLVVESSSTSAQVSSLLKALMEAGLNLELLGILEQILLTETPFASNVNLQNLLLATAIKNDPSRVPDYLTRLDKYDVDSLSKLATSLGLHKVCFSLLKARGRNSEALDALLSDTSTEALEMALEHVKQLNLPDLWFRLGRAYLDRALTSEAIDAYLNSGYCADHERIKAACGDDVQLLLKWLRNAKGKSRQLDTDLLITLATSDNSEEYCSILQGEHYANVTLVGDELCKLGLYEKAVHAFNSTSPNYAKLAVCYLHLMDYSSASEAALKSRNPQVLEQVVQVCMEQEQLEMAQEVALDLLTFQDFLPSVTRAYEQNGFFDPYIQLLEQAKPSVAISTELAIAIAKYKPEALMDHLIKVLEKDRASGINVHKVAKECCNLYLWKEAILLYSIDSPDKALVVMTTHSPVAWDQDMFLKCCKACQNPDALCKALQLLVQQQPLLIPKFLNVCGHNMDPTIVIRITRPSCLEMVREYLESLKNPSKYTIDALSYIYLKLELPQELSKLLDTTSETSINLAAPLEQHRMVDMRMVAAKIYAKTRNFEQAAKIYRVNGNLAQVLNCILTSSSEAAALDMLTSLAQEDKIAQFVAASIILADVVALPKVLEIAWIYNIDIQVVWPLVILEAYKSQGQSTSRSAKTLALGFS